jgi:ABC-2 type transport system permease protein
VDERAAVRYHTNRPTFREFSRIAEEVVSAAALAVRAEKLKVSPAELKEAARPVPVLDKGLVKRDPETGKVEEGSEQSRILSFMVPFMLIMLMFMVILMGATPLMQGVVEEKMQRIAEVLLGSVTPFQMMMGKLIGMVGVSLTVVAVYLGGAYWAAHHFGFVESVTPELMVWFLVYQSLAALMYGSLFIAVGAACSETKETQTMIMPVTLLACLPMFLLVNVIQEPNGPVATGFSFFPFATPMLMVARQAIPPGVPWWHPPAAVLLVLATTVLCVWVAGRIFRVGILMQGKGANLAQLARWVVRG